MAGSSVDGCSQIGRRWPALDPASAPVDGRSALDLLAFVQALTRELRYIDDNPGSAGKSAGEKPCLLASPLALTSSNTETLRSCSPASCSNACNNRTLSTA